jgi:hypothetical protein
VQSGYDLVSWDNSLYWSVGVRPYQRATNPNEMPAIAHWANDSVWLLPLRLREPEITLNYDGPSQVAGKMYEVLRVGYRDVIIRLFIDPVTHLVGRSESVLGVDTWGEYRKFGGLLLATEHKLDDQRVWFTNVSLTRDFPGWLSIRAQMVIIFLCFAGWLLVWAFCLRPLRHAHASGPHGAGRGDALSSLNRWWSYRGPPH